MNDKTKAIIYNKMKKEIKDLKQQVANLTKQLEDKNNPTNIVTFGAKCSDMFYSGDYDGYVPDNLGIGGGDYIDIEVDVETGRIIGWNTEAVKEFMKNGE